MPVSEALREAQKRYYNKIMSNPETKKVFLEKSKKYLENYRNKIKHTEQYIMKQRENAKKYYYNHHEEVKEKNKKYYHDNKEMIKESILKRKEIKLKSPTILP